MEQAVLLREEYDGGQRLTRRLKEWGVEVFAVFWAKRSEDRMWSLYIVSPRVDTDETLANFLELRRALESLESEWSHPFEHLKSDRVKLVRASDRLAERVVDFLAKYSLPLPRWHYVGLSWPDCYDQVLVCPLPQLTTVQARTG